jgi:Pectate lyase superfamily protein
VAILQNLVQRIWGVFHPVSGALLGLTISGETPYFPVNGSFLNFPSVAGVGSIHLVPGTGGVTAASAGCYLTPGDGGGGLYLFNPLDTTSGCFFLGSISGTALTVASVFNGAIAIGQNVYGPNGAAVGRVLAGAGASWTLSGSGSTAGNINLSADTGGPILTGLDGGRWYLTAGNGSVPVPPAPTNAETAAGITPTNYSYPEIMPRRYGADGTGGAADTTALAAVRSVLGALAMQLLQISWIGSIINPKTAAETAASAVIASYAYPVLNALRYGADPTGATDSTAAINTAVAVALHYDVTTVAAVYIPQGIYKVCSLGTSPGAPNGGVTFRGDGSAATFLVNYSTNLPTLIAGNVSTPSFNGGFEGICVTQAGGVAAGAGNTGFSVIKLNNFTLSDLAVTASVFGSSIQRGIDLNAASQVLAQDIVVTSCLENGIQLTATIDVYLINMHSDANGADGFSLSGAQGCYFVNCTGFNNGSAAWNLLSALPASLPNFNNTFIECGGDTSASYNWLIADSINSQWIGGWGSTQKNPAVNTFASGVFVKSQYCHDLVFLGMEASFNNADGFQVFDDGVSGVPFNINFVGCVAGTTGHGNGRGGSGSGFDVNGGVHALRILGGQSIANATMPARLATTGGLAAQDIVVRDVIGFTSVNQGMGTIGIGNSSAVVTHGLGFTPDASLLHAWETSNMVSSAVHTIWVDTFNATQFTVHTDVNVAGSTFNFGWTGRFPGS